jgi:hypothetical protein
MANDHLHALTALPWKKRLTFQYNRIPGGLMDGMEDNNFLLCLTLVFSVIRYITLLLDCWEPPTL